MLWKTAQRKRKVQVDKKYWNSQDNVTEYEVNTNSILYTIITSELKI